MPTLELEQIIQQELEINPLLELNEEQEDAEDEESEDSEETQETEQADTAEEAEEPEASAEEESQDEELDFDEADLDNQFDEDDWNEFMNESGYISTKEEFDPNIEEWDNQGASQVSLEDTLKEQLLLSELDAAGQEIGEFLIGNIDEDGFLILTTEEVADILGVDTEEVERVLGVIHTFEPSGVGARDLRECLMIQLKEQGEDGCLAMLVVRDHLDDWIGRRYSRVCRVLNIGREELSDVQDVIATLNPKPGFTPEPRVNFNLVVPDLEVTKVGEDFIVSLTDRNAPSLRISPIYRTLLSQSEKSGTDAKKFVVERLNSARWFISAIHQRRTTMLRVMRCIVQSQREFFDHGLGHLRPMVLQEVADKVGMHVSTISRVSNGKYVQTPHGVFELKYFFDGGLSTDEGEDVSAKTVKEKISTLIDEEDAQNPLSDQKIADILKKKEGTNIARRTVAKYRDQLGINPARYRKSI